MRTSTHGLAVGSAIRITNAPSRRHARGVITRLFQGLVEFRADYDGSIRLAKLADVHTRRKARAGRRSQEVAA